MAAKPAPKGPGDDLPYEPPPPPPVTQIPTTGVGTQGHWQVPMVAPNFTFPQGLLAQIAAAQQPSNAYGSAFGRFGFSQGSPQPPWSPPNWGRAPTQGSPWNRPPVGWNQPIGWGVPNMGQPQQPQQQSGPPTSAPPSYADKGGLLGKVAPGAVNAAQQGQIPQGQQPQGLLTWGGQPQASPPMTPASSPANVGWSPQQGQSMQQNMDSYNSYINQSPQAFLAGFHAQPSQQAKIEFLMRAPPSVSSALMNDPGVQQALGGQNWRQNFTSGYYNAPAR